MKTLSLIAAPALALGLLVAGGASAQDTTNTMSTGNMTGNSMSHGHMTAAQKKAMGKSSGSMSKGKMTGNSDVQWFDDQRKHDRRLDDARQHDRRSLRRLAAPSRLFRGGAALLRFD